jgi:hypothetical protein
MKRSISAESFSSAISDPSFNAFNVLSNLKGINQNLDIDDDDDQSNDSEDDFSDSRDYSPLQKSNTSAPSPRIRGAATSETGVHYSGLKRRKKGNDEERVKRW